MEEVTHNPQDVGEWIELANAAADEGNKEKARECLLNAVKADPESVQAWNYLSYFAESRDEEIHALEKVLQLQPENQSAAERLQKVEGDTN
jgi:cytochrome c-type biogenesis protein CcmH/NrfG